MINLLKKHTRNWGIVLMVAGVLLSGELFSGEIGYAASNQVETKPKTDNSLVALKSNGTITQHTGILREGKVWVPVTFMHDVLRMPIVYDRVENSYAIGKGITKTMIIVSDYATSIYVNNYYIKEYEGKMINNRLYVPFGLLDDYLGYRGDFSPANGQLNIVPRIQNAMAITTDVYFKDSEAALINLEYPKISLANKPDVQKLINNTLRESALKFAKGANTDVANRIGTEPTYEYNSAYVVTYNQNNVLSLVMYQYSNTGGVHGMTNREAFTFSLKDGKRLLLGDLFGANPNYKKQLNAELSKLVKAEEGYLGGFNGLNTEKYFYLKDNKVVLFFQLYEYTAYAVGFPEYTFSYKELLPDGSSPFAALK